MSNKTQKTKDNSIIRGKWIVIEGPDRIGKSTLIENLSNKLIDDGINVMTNAFPRRQTVIGSILDRSLKVSENNRIVEGKPQTLLFLADMLEAYKSIEEYISTGGVVITDRYIMSTYAYAMAQYDNIRNNENWIESALELMPKPDVFIFLQPSNMSLEFITKRSGFGGENTEKKEIQELVLYYMQKYHIQNLNMVQTIVVDENMTPETICDSCLTLLMEKFVINIK
jgi:dTMP kinase